MLNSTAQGYAARASGESLLPFSYELPPLGEQDIQVAVSHCGVCYTDIQGINDHYGIATFPFVPGHEIVGTVTVVGNAVKDKKVGDRVGIGWQGKSCGKCEFCLRGDPQLCVEIDVCGVWRPYGGFSNAVIVDNRFAYLLPEKMASETAAVLMCAGISTFTPLWTYVKDGGKKVAVIGVGGLGHLAIQFAHALGCDVTAISSSAGKKDEALKFGADNFLLIDDMDGLRKQHYTFDLVLFTSHGKGDWTEPMNLVKNRGRFVVIGFPDEKILLDPMELIVYEMAITGSFIGNPEMMRRMLAFSQEKSIQPMVELMPMSKANDAVERVKANKARYRIVLANDLITQ